ncbi:hypothetical protein [Spiroplasma sp. AdecLV25b]|uniref:hypothetical protein n=1 Tax=Spiroplasma sp. AdecLV25b TaxID=3027162 RepID=UPI0027DEE5FB|nr:hypothetical protein [Spiroplasma sp. AdecLV25b]
MEFKLNLGEPYKEIRDFLEFRMNKKDYRGFHILQHNRMTASKIKGLIDSFLEVGCDYIKLPKGDEYVASKNKGFKLVDYPDYEKFVKLVYTKNKQGTANSIKKNILPDLARMNIFDRYDVHLKKIDPFSKCESSFFALNKEYNKYYDDENLLSQLISTKIKLLFNDLIQCIFDILVDLKKLTLNEFLLFVTWVGKDYRNKKMDSNAILFLIKEYISLSKSQKEQINIEIKNFANPKANWQKILPKNEKKDYSNWKNESQQIFKALKEFSLFHLNESGDEISLKVFKDEKGNIVKFARSFQPKKEYFKNHNVEKNYKFELDHIVPFSLITNYESYMKIDNWQNMLYIDANTHSVKTKKRNKYIFLKKGLNYDLKMVAHDGEFLPLKNNENMLININKTDDILNYNNFLIKKYNL